MCRSIYHNSIKDLFSHYFCPLHLFSVLIRYQCRTQNKMVKNLIRSFLKNYDALYRAIFLTGDI